MVFLIIFRETLSTAHFLSFHESTSIKHVLIKEIRMEMY